MELGAPCTLNSYSAASCHIVLSGIITRRTKTRSHLRYLTLPLLFNPINVYRLVVTFITTLAYMSTPSLQPFPVTARLPSSEELRDIQATLYQPKDLSPLSRDKEENYNAVPCTEPRLEKGPAPPSELRQNLFMIFITLTQLVQMIPLGVGINSGLAIGEALDAPHINSVWIVASYPMTQGAFVLIGKYSPSSFFPFARKKLLVEMLILESRRPSWRSIWS